MIVEDVISEVKMVIGELCFFFSPPTLQSLNL